MDSPGWFDSGYVVPGTDSEIGGKKIFTNYNNTRMYIEGQTSVIEEDFREHWYFTGKSFNYQYDIFVGYNSVTYGCDVYSDLEITKTKVIGSKTEVIGSQQLLHNIPLIQIYNNSYNKIKAKVTQIWDMLGNPRYNYIYDDNRNRTLQSNSLPNLLKF